MRNPRVALRNCSIPSNYKDIAEFVLAVRDLSKPDFQDRYLSSVPADEHPYASKRVRHFPFIGFVCLAYVDLRLLEDAAEQNNWDNYCHFYDQLYFPYKPFYLRWMLGREKFSSYVVTCPILNGAPVASLFDIYMEFIYAIGDPIFNWKHRKRIELIEGDFPQLKDCVVPDHDSGKNSDILAFEDSTSLRDEPADPYRELMENELIKKYMSCIPEHLYDISTDTWKCPLNLTFMYVDAVYKSCLDEDRNISKLGVIETFASHFGKNREYFYRAKSKKLKAKEFIAGYKDYDDFVKAFPDYMKMARLE